MVGKVGFEPTSPFRETDLQSAATLQLRRLPITNYIIENLLNQLVPQEGLEPSPEDWLLRPACLPISPPRPWWVFFNPGITHRTR